MKKVICNGMRCPCFMHDNGDCLGDDERLKDASKD